MTSKTQSLVHISPGIFRRLRQGLERMVGDQAAPMLQEAGFSSGDDVYGEFRAWLLSETGVENPPELDAELMSDLLSRFFSQAGWGEVTLERMGSAALCMSSSSWAEASGADDGDLPSCHVTTGMLAAFLGHLADNVVAVMEVECRTSGDAACRFLIGAPDTLQIVFEGLSQGSDYETLLTTTT